MIRCSKCGRQLGVNDRFCPDCGEKLVLTENKSHQNAGNQNTQNPTRQGGTQSTQRTAPQTGTQSTQRTAPQTGTQSTQRTAPQTGTQNSPKRPTQQNAVKYVYVDKRTGKITGSPHSGKRSEGCLSFLGIAIAALAIVVAMVAGSVLVARHFSGRSVSSKEGENVWYFEEDSSSDTSSQAVTSSEEKREDPVSSEAVSSDVVSSEPVSSVQTIPDDLLAVNLQRKIKGKWRTDVPYKSMNLPGTFEFDGKGNCKFTVSAFLFSKKFQGKYSIMDGGLCELRLDGIEEYLDDDTMVGQLRFITDDKIQFTVGDTVWNLNRVE